VLRSTPRVGAFAVTGNRIALGSPGLAASGSSGRLDEELTEAIETCRSLAPAGRTADPLGLHRTPAGEEPLLDGEATVNESPSRVAIYARVSSTKQETENQVAQLNEYSSKMGWSVVRVLRETEHGWEPDRKKLTELFGMAERREIDIALVWALDRFSRQGIGPTIHLIDGLHASGVRLWSYREAFLRETDPSVSKLMVSILAWVAEQEHLRISDRTKAGLERVRKEQRSYDAPRGKRPVGRRPLYVIDRTKAQALLDLGSSWRGTLKALNLPPGALASLRRVCRKGSPASLSTGEAVPECVSNRPIRHASPTEEVANRG
jgi:putative DNA-invertase from lambdoid prophage Rac